MSCLFIRPLRLDDYEEWDTFVGIITGYAVQVNLA